MLSSLPFELLEEILHFAIDVHPARYAIPQVNSTWANISLPILHARITLSTLWQLHLFSVAPGELCCAPRGREVDILLPGGTDGMNVWGMIYDAFAKCQAHTTCPSSSCYRGIRVLRLCLNSHLSDNNVQFIGDALCMVNPEVFTWTGPDPDHHFSTAIVPTAVTQLCKAIFTWTSLKRLELSNIAFHNDGLELALALITMCDCPPFPFRPPDTNTVGPVQIVIRQAVFMHPISVVRIALGVPALRELRLVDVYQHSIWGPRVRMVDVERSRLTVPFPAEYKSRGPDQDCLERLRDVVSCIAKTERLVGGDREVQEDP